MRTSKNSPTPLNAACIGVLCIAFSWLVHSPYKVIYNASRSAPRGWYALRPSHVIPVGALVVARLPDSPTRLADERHYLPKTVPFLKRVSAAPGDTVCERKGEVMIDGRLIASARVRDGAGRLLTPWAGCRVLAPDEFFLLNPDSNSSFDGRYYGPISRACVIGIALPLWTW